MQHSLSFKIRAAPEVRSLDRFLGRVLLALLQILVKVLDAMDGPDRRAVFFVGPCSSAFTVVNTDSPLFPTASQDHPRALIAFLPYVVRPGHFVFESEQLKDADSRSYFLRDDLALIVVHALLIFATLARCCFA